MPTGRTVGQEQQNDLHGFYCNTLLYMDVITIEEWIMNYSLWALNTLGLEWQYPEGNGGHSCPRPLLPHQGGNWGNWGWYFMPPDLRPPQWPLSCSVTDREYPWKHSLGQACPWASKAHLQMHRMAMTTQFPFLPFGDPMLYVGIEAAVDVCGHTVWTLSPLSGVWICIPKNIPLEVEGAFDKEQNSCGLALSVLYLSWTLGFIALPHNP